LARNSTKWYKEGRRWLERNKLFASLCKKTLKKYPNTIDEWIL
jgi:hypothetical protein